MRKRQPQGLNRLSVAAIKHLATPGWHGDGGGLYLEIDANGRKRWALRLTVNGKRRDFGLGPLHKVSLADAREVAAIYRAKAYRGIDPVADKKKRFAMPGMPTFKDAAEQVHRQRAQGWSNGKHVDQWINTLAGLRLPHHRGYAGQRYRYSRHSESPHPHLERQGRDRAERAAADFHGA